MHNTSTPPNEARAVLDFWFGELDGQGMPLPAKMERWFARDDRLDAEIRDRFGTELEQAEQLNHWRNTAHGTLALVVLVDQFARNVHRGSPQAFAKDSLALSISHEALDADVDRGLLPIERVFLYMPLEHAEDPESQDRSAACFHALADEVPVELREQFRQFAAFADSHREVIHRFGRFPHRNEMLGRESTDAELEYLSNGAPHWGQEPSSEGAG
jgi:uncharacterized protein (DUF924 family)